MSDVETDRDISDTIADRDAQVGRWRSLQHPDIVGYAVGTKGTRVNLFHEADGRSYEVSKGNVDKPWFGNYPGVHEAAREYFDTHPEPRPWQDARPGEVWVLRYSDDLIPHAYVMNSRGVFVGVMCPSPHDESIIAGRRIWSEAPHE
jgi:hypothetical protein